MWRILVLLAVVGCGRDIGRGPAPCKEAPQSDLVMAGNSHTNTNGLVAVTAEASGNLRTHRAISGAFLDDIAAAGSVFDAVRAGGVKVVCLQGQKISMSHKYTYSTEAGERIAKAAHEAGAKVFWFAEWSRSGVDETAYIEAIYRGMAQRSFGTVVPVGRVFDRVATALPGLVLLAGDGNHANQAGTCVAGVSIAFWINGGSHADFRVLGRAGLDSNQTKSVEAAVRAVWLEDHPDVPGLPSASTGVGTPAGR